MLGRASVVLTPENGAHAEFKVDSGEHLCFCNFNLYKDKPINLRSLVRLIGLLFN